MDVTIICEFYNPPEDIIEYYTNNVVQRMPNCTCSQEEQKFYVYKRIVLEGSYIEFTFETKEWNNIPMRFHAFELGCIIPIHYNGCLIVNGFMMYSHNNSINISYYTPEEDFNEDTF